MRFAVLRRLFLVLAVGTVWALVACSEADSYLDNPNLDESALSSSSSALRYDTHSPDSTQESVDTAAFIAEELGACTETREGEITKTTFCGETCFAICDSSLWRYATKLERDMEGFPEDTVEGAILKGNLLSLDHIYVFEDGRWRLMTFAERAIGICTPEIYSKIDSVRGIYYYCREIEKGGSAWSKISAYRADEYLAPPGLYEGEIILGERSGRYLIYEDSLWHGATMSEVVGYCREERFDETLTFYGSVFRCNGNFWQLAERYAVLGDCLPALSGEKKFDGPLEFVCDGKDWNVVGLHSHKVDSTFFWDGYEDYEGRILLSEDSDSTGQFFEFTDGVYGGLSAASYPISLDMDKNGVELDQLVIKYGSIEAFATFLYGYGYPFVGFGFHVWNGAEWGDASEGADIRPWKGLCVGYESDSPLVVAIAPEGDAHLVGGNFHKVVLPPKDEPSVVNISFDEFRQDYDWGNGIVLDTVLASAASVLFYVEGKPMEKSWFRVGMIGSYGQCGPEE